ncbi:essential MCU regulator, mitochondrial-like [Xenopus laevis]|uniref:Essential MCU regulator, mitochondrial n=2 Tax=Xenopus laevis TaxID=8355 RepID=A0A974D736_XENLA|nr:essential MCU regulator, mitochondrial-like [Xenopus laevis]OCT85377.1 hypothetical protein XELAEV_18023544mg [Xenopus laevis]
MERLLLYAFSLPAQWAWLSTLRIVDVGCRETLTTPHSRDVGYRSPVFPNMAARIGVLSVAGFRAAARAGGLLTRPKQSMAVGHVPCRTVIASNGGAILPKPQKVSFGLLRVFTVVIPFLYIGTLMSKNFAALLEEHDIFVPEDDDDDD